VSDFTLRRVRSVVDEERKLLDANVASLIALGVNKDYTQLNADELCEAIAAAQP